MISSSSVAAAATATVATAAPFSCVVGYALNAKKLRKSSADPVEATPIVGSPSRLNWKGGGLADILENSSEDFFSDGLEYVQWDHEIPLQQQPHFDVIIHKLTEDIYREESSEKLSALQAYLSAHPRTVIVDPISAVHNVISRLRTCERLERIQQQQQPQQQQQQHKQQLKSACTAVSAGCISAAAVVTSRKRQLDNENESCNSSVLNVSSGVDDTPSNPNPAPTPTPNNTIGDNETKKITPVEPYHYQNCPFTQPAYVFMDSDPAISFTSRSNGCSSSSSSKGKGNSINSNSNSCSTPVSVLYRNNTILQAMRARNMVFPVICKPVDACGTPSSHNMVVVVSPADLHMIPYPCVIQQYYNHNNNLFKVYVVGEDVMVFRRPSLPNVVLCPHCTSCPSSSSSSSSSCYSSSSSSSCIASSTLYASSASSSGGSHPGGEAGDACSSAPSLSAAFCGTGTGTGTTMSFPAPDGSISSSPPSTVRSVAFDSRRSYPTISDFCPDATNNNYNGVHASRMCAGNKGGHGVADCGPLLAERKSPPAAVPAVPPSIEKDKKEEEGQGQSVGVVEDELCFDGVPYSEFKSTAEIIKREFGLSLFGFDVIVPAAGVGTQCSACFDKVAAVAATAFASAVSESVSSALSSAVSVVSSSSGEVEVESTSSLKVVRDTPLIRDKRLRVIDINYFPSYKEVGDFPHRLRQLLINSSSKKKQQQQQQQQEQDYL